MSCVGSGGSGSMSDWAGSDTHGCRVGAGWAVQRSTSSTAQLQPHLSPVLCRQPAAAALGAAPWCTAGTDSNAHVCSGLRSEQSCFGAERAEQSRAGQKAEQQPGSAVPISPAAPSAPRWSRAEQSTPRPAAHSPPPPQHSAPSRAAGRTRSRAAARRPSATVSTAVCRRSAPRAPAVRFLPGSSRHRPPPGRARLRVPPCVRMAGRQGLLRPRGQSTRRGRRFAVRGADLGRAQGTDGAKEPTAAPGLGPSRPPPLSPATPSPPRCTALPKAIAAQTAAPAPSAPFGGKEQLWGGHTERHRGSAGPSPFHLHPTASRAGRGAARGAALSSHGRLQSDACPELSTAGASHRNGAPSPERSQSPTTRTAPTSRTARARRAQDARAAPIPALWKQKVEQSTPGEPGRPSSPRTPRMRRPPSHPRRRIPI